MHKYILLLLYSFLAFLPLSAETILSGKIGDITIDQSGNPFIITDNITIPQGKKLTIKEGVVLLFKPFTGLLIEGSLVVEGSPDQSVVFTTENNGKYNPASKQLPNPFDWNGIFITNKAEFVKLSNFLLEYSVYGIKSQKEVFTISDGIFARNGQFHVTVNETIKNVVDDIPFNYGKEFEPKVDIKKKTGDLYNSSTSSKEPSMRATWKKPVGIGLTLLGVSTIGTGGYFYFLSNKYNSQYKSASLHEEMEDNFSKMNSSRTTAGVCLATGIISAVCGIAIYPWKSEPDTVKKFSIFPILGKQNGFSIYLNY